MPEYEIEVDTAFTAAPTPEGQEPRVDWTRVMVYHDTQRNVYEYTFPDGIRITIDADRVVGFPDSNDRVRYIEELYFEERRQKAMAVEGDSKKDRTQMTLNDVSVCLERYFHSEKYPDGIAFPNDLDGHKYCFIHTNCPEAVRIRKYLDEAGVTLEEISAVWKEVGHPPSPEKLTYTFPDLSSKLKIRIAGKDIELDMEEEVKKMVSQGLKMRLENLRYSVADLQSLGNELFRHYFDVIREARKDRTLPQVAFSRVELLKYKCMISSEGSRDTYHCIFPLMYNPQWLYSREVRYKLHSKHVEALCKEVYLVIPVTLGGKYLVPFLVDIYGNKFRHYHGTNHDCWGWVKIPERWKGTLEEVAALAKQMETALTTINEDSLMTGCPPNMPTVPALKKKAKKVGKEGQREVGAEEITEDRKDDAPPPPRGWGEADDTNAGQDGQQTEPEEVVNPEERRQ